MILKRKNKKNYQIFFWIIYKDNKKKKKISFGIHLNLKEILFKMELSMLKSTTQIITKH